jgi:hypothetical protein
VSSRCGGKLRKKFPWRRRGYAIAPQLPQRGKSGISSVSHRCWGPHFQDPILVASVFRCIPPKITLLQTAMDEWASAALECPRKAVPGRHLQMDVCTTRNCSCSLPCICMLTGGSRCLVKSPSSAHDHKPSKSRREWPPTKTNDPQGLSTCSMLGVLRVLPSRPRPCKRFPRTLCRVDVLG